MPRHVVLVVLALDGTSDFVTAEADHRRIVEIVNKHDPGARNSSPIDGMDHDLDAAGPLLPAFG